MRSFAKGAVVFALAVAMTALSACSDQQTTTPGSPGSNGASAIGSSQYNAALPPPSPSGTVVGGAVDQSDSQNLTDYLKNHHLPLVNGQVVMSPAGKRQVILFGYVASQYGKSDAEQKARTFLNDPQLLVDNRITISPELAGSDGGGSSNGSSNGSSSASTGGSGSNYDPYAQSNSIQAYQQQGAGFNPYAAQQQYPTNNFSGLNLLMGLLGGGMSIGGGGGGFGGGFGGGGGYGGFGGGPPSSFGGYGYPSYPPPPMGSGFP